MLQGSPIICLQTFLLETLFPHQTTHGFPTFDSSVAVLWRLSTIGPMIPPDLLQHLDEIEKDWNLEGNLGISEQLCTAQVIVIILSVPGPETVQIDPSPILNEGLV